MKTDPGDLSSPDHQSELMTALRRLRAEARYTNERERGHLLWLPGQELGVDAADVYRW